MTAERYKKVYDWFIRRPAAHRLLTVVTKGLPLAVAGCYGLLLAYLAWDWLGKRQTAMTTSFTGWQEVADAAFAQLARCIVVPAVVFLAGSVLRAVINAPRPYEAPGFVPLVPKSTKGRAFPSRHCLSAGIIAVVGFAVHPTAGAVLTAAAVLICVTRVLAGVHRVRDVLAGVLLGAVCCAAGLLLW